MVSYSVLSDAEHPGGGGRRMDDAGSHNTQAIGIFFLVQRC